MSDTVVKFTPSVKFTEIYNTLRKIDMSDRMQTKQGLNYVPWAAALDEVEGAFPSPNIRALSRVNEKAFSFVLKSGM